MLGSARFTSAAPQTPTSIIKARADRLLAGVALLAVAMPASALAQSALPSGGSVVTGTASIAQPSANSLLVTQTSQNAIVNWNSFSVGSGYSVRFENGSGATLNRVTGFSPSQIDGSLSASGSLFLVNPAGITVGATGVVSTGGSFVASTHDVSNEEFLAGGSMTFSGTSRASVINYGAIGALGGDVALIARKVENAGTITAPNGTVALAAGYEVLVRDSALSDGKIVVKVGGSDTEAKTSGVIAAAEAELRANGGNVYALAGNTKSITKATGVASKGGRVFLTAGDGGTVTVSQTVTARGKTTGSKTTGSKTKGGEIRVSGGTVQVSGTLDAKGEKDTGGTIVVTGQDVTLQSGATLDASGAAGGTILVGGDYQGGLSEATKYLSETVSTAQRLTVEAGATLRADGSQTTGGHVVAWSDENTTFAGIISATGITRGGDAEVSGKAVLEYTGTVDLRAAAGAWGTLLLDPYNLSITTGTDTGMSGFAASADDSVLNVGTLTTALATANVTVTTGSSGGQAGNISVLAPVTWSSGSVLTLAASGSITVNAAITATGAGSGLVLQYGAGQGYSVNAPITLTGAGATLQIGETGALHSYTLLTSMAQIDAIETSGLSGYYALAQDLDAAGTVYTQALVSGSFTGTFAGLGHTISNLVINAPDSNNVGVFANADYGSTLRDITLLNGSVTGKGSVGSLAGIAAGMISNATSNLSVVGSDMFVGGLVGLNSGGGGGIWDSSATGSVSGVDYVGGLAGNSQASITRSYASGTVTGRSYIGGLAGVTGDTIAQSYATGAVTGTGDAVGGLIGLNGAMVDRSYATGAVTGTSNTGGLVGLNYGGVTNTYALGSVTGTTNVGGLVGSNQDGFISVNYASGAVTGSSAVGGLVGSNSAWGSVESSYWDKETTGQAQSAGSADSYGLTTLQARQQASYSGWDFSSVWYQSGDMRPIGRWEAAEVAGGVATITNLHQLQLITTNLGAAYVLANDIDASATDSTASSSDIWGASGFQPIGTSSAGFSGTFDGAGHVISGLTIKSAQNYVGLFGYTETSAVIRDVGLTDGWITGGTFYVGGLVGYNQGRIEDAYNTGKVGGGPTTSNIQGGLAGYNSGTIRRSYATGTVTNAWTSGGLVGENAGTVEASYATGDVGGANMNTVGGLIGANTGGTVSQVYATGTVTGSGPLGGLIGQVDSGTVTQAYATGDVTGTWNDAGGLIGRLNGGTVSQVYATGDVAIPLNKVNAGGLVGYSAGSISQAYATGTVTGGQYVGGLAGSNDGAITESYSSGAVRGNSDVGGLVGLGGGSVTSSYWDVEASGQDSSAGGDGLYSADARNPASYAGWDFSTVWFQSGDMRPIGRWEAAEVVDGVATITNLHQLQLISTNLGATYVLANDIDARATDSTAPSSSIWGASGFQPIDYFFSGALDGQGHVISGLTIHAGSSGDVGLFRYLADGASVSNLGLAGGSVSGGNNVGALAGTMGNVTITSVSADVDITASSYGGGLIGQAYGGSITGSHASGDVTVLGPFAGGLVGSSSASITSSSATGDVFGAANVGGLAGMTMGPTASVSFSYATGNVTSTGGYTGGLIGGSSAAVTESYASGDVSGTTYVGGLIGMAGGSISRSNASGDVTGTDMAVGGLAGSATASVTQTYATGTVTGTSNVGGLVGMALAGITQSYATGDVSGTAYVGGLAGYLQGAISESYASGRVTATSDAGGFVGFNNGSISSSYWDTETSGQSQGIGSGSAAGLTGLTTAEARQAASYVGWDFDTVWYQTDDMRPIGRWEAAEVVDGVATIVNLHQLQLINLNLAGSYVLAGDIDASATDGTRAASVWSSRGFVSLGTLDTMFTGALDGAGHGINGLTLNRQDATASGLFAAIADTGSVENVALTDVSISGGILSGALAGLNMGHISQASVTGTVSGTLYAGGLIGGSLGTVTHATSSATVTSEIGSAGGLAGLSMFGSISDSSASGTVTGYEAAGGLVGINLGTIARSYATGDVYGTNDVGGLVGQNSVSITESYASGRVVGTQNVGGLVGISDGEISRSYALGRVIGEDSVGGLVGHNFGTVSETYASGRVDGLTHVGGLVGISDGTVTSSYWDKQTTGQAHSAGSDDSAGLTTDAARQASSYVGWDFGTVWFQSADMRPIGRWEAAEVVDGVATITNLHQLQLVAVDLTASYVLGADIDASDTAGATASGVWGAGGFVPLGDAQTAFTGTFDGAGHQISALTITRADVDTVGLFGAAGAGSVIANVDLVGVSVTGQNMVGALIGMNLGGTVSDVTAQGQVTGASSVGGLAGYSEAGAYSNVSTSGAVSGDTINGNGTGGLIGRARGDTITSAYSTATVSGGVDVGGLVGALTADDNSHAGLLTYAYATGAVSGTGTNVGGLVGGAADSRITYAYATGSVSVTVPDDVTGEVFVGGLVGDNYYSAITQAYASGQVIVVNSSADVKTGGLAGRSDGGSVENSYWDMQTTGQADGFGAGGGDATGLTTAEARNAASYVGWNFSTVWYQSGDMRPIGRWEAAEAVNGVIAVSNLHQLQLVNVDLSGRYVLTGDIDASDTSGETASGVWGAKGFQSIGSTQTRFDGTFDGAGHVIENLTITTTSASSELGLFSVTGEGAVIRNVGLVGGAITGGDTVGALVGLNFGQVTQAYSSAAVSGVVAAGGLIGENQGSVTRSYASGTVSGETFVGGLIGRSAGVVSQVYATGAVSGLSSVGGLIGNLDGGTLTQAYATGSVTGANTAGGLIGIASGAHVTQAYASGHVSANVSAGGLIGYSAGNSTITASYWDQETTGQATSAGGGTGLTTAAARDAASYVGWDFDQVWYQTADMRPIGRWEAAEAVNGVVAVSTVHQLQLINTDLAGTYVLARSFDAGETSGLDPASVFGSGGFVSLGSSAAPFSGTIDGAGNAISSLTINRPSETAVGLVSTLGTSGIITSLELIDAKVTGASEAGIVAGRSSGLISDVTAGGVADAAGGTVGGVAGLLDGGRVVGAVSTASIGTLAPGAKAGGVVGEAAAGSLIADTTSSGQVAGTDDLGGIAGKITGTYVVNTFSFSPSVTGSGNSVGGLVGEATAQSVILASGLPFGGAGAGVAGASAVGGLVGLLDTSQVIGSAVTTVVGGVLPDVTATGEYAGGLVGLAISSTITGSQAAANVEATNYAGGLAGATMGSATISDSSASGTVTANGMFAGGLVGATGVAIPDEVAPDTTDTLLTRVYATSDVSGDLFVGGLVGRNNGTVTDAFATGDVTGSTLFVGGLIGNSVGDVTRTYASGTVTGGDTVGGLIGYVAGGTVSQSFASGAVSGTGVAGGLAGYNFGTISQSYATGSVTGSDGSTSVGGLVGDNAGGTITESYAAGAVSGGSIRGGLVATNSGTVSTSYWDKEATGQTTSAGSDASFGLTSAQMHDWNSFVGWSNVVWAPADATHMPELYGVSGVVGVVQSMTYGDNPATDLTISYLGIGWWNAVSGTATLATTPTSTTNAGLTTTTVTGLTGTYQGGGSTRIVGVTDVSKRAITVTADSTNRAYGDANPSFTYVVGGGGLVNGDTVGTVFTGALASDATTASNVGGYAITQGTLALASSNYTLTGYTAGTLTVTARAITVTADSTNRAYGDANPLLTYVVGGGGLVNGDTVGTVFTGALASDATTASNVGGYAITQGTLALASSNYTLTGYTAGTLTVTARAITVTADNTNRAYGDANPPLTYAVGGGGLVNGDTVGTVFTGALASDATTTSNVGGYAITQGTLALASSNYTLTGYTAGTLTVTARTITVTADNTSRLVGQANPPLTYAVGGAGLVNGDTLSGALVTAADTTSPPGTYAILQGTLSASSNYTISSYTPGALEVLASYQPLFVQTTPDFQWRLTRDLWTLLQDELPAGDTAANDIVYSPWLKMKGK